MNTADQGVYPMDTAFKRRWSFKYIPLDGLKSDTWKEDNWNPPIAILNGVRWQSFRQGINHYVRSQSKSGTLEIPIPEDKLIGPYFLSERELSGDLQEAIIEKVFFYLQFDVLKYSPNVLFNEPLTMSEIREKANEDSLWQVLNEDLKSDIQQFEPDTSKSSQSDNAE